MIESANARGHVVVLETNHKDHFNGIHKTERPVDDVGGSFMDALMKAVGNVNDLQANSDDMMKKMIYEPESVDIHQVMIAQQKAEISLTLTKTIRDEALKSYRELVNLR